MTEKEKDNNELSPDQLDQVVGGVAQVGLGVVGAFKAAPAAPKLSNKASLVPGENGH